MTVRRVPEGHYIKLDKDNINSIEQLGDILYTEYYKDAVENFLHYTYNTLQTIGTVYIGNDDNSYSRIYLADIDEYIQYQQQQQLGEIA